VIGTPRASPGVIAIALVLTACISRQSPLVTLHREPVDSGVLLTLVAAPGARINARLVPTLERRDGALFRFDPPDGLSDFNYYSDAPHLFVDGNASGVVRVSVCPAGEQVCRVVEVSSDR
jgi:hypothetical protein